MIEITFPKIRKSLCNIYENRLNEALAEADVFDDRGNLVIGKDLKVRHKKSQFEYTVDGVIEDPSTGDVQIVLRLPDEPRIEPENPEAILVSTPGDIITDADEFVSVSDLLDSPKDDEVVFVVDKEEFEQDYEVK